MSDLRVVATIPARVDAVGQVRQALADLATASQQDQGCVAYEVFESAAAPGTFVTVETWASQADLDAHLATGHVATAFEVAGPLLAGDVAIHPLVPLA